MLKYGRIPISRSSSIARHSSSPGLFTVAMKVKTKEAKDSSPSQVEKLKRYASYVLSHSIYNFIVYFTVEIESSSVLSSLQCCLAYQPQNLG